jgi:outer membrane protein assembly factor BamA
VDVHAAGPIAESDLRKATGLNAKDPVSPMLAELAKTSVKRPLQDAGYLDAAARETSQVDKATHTVSYSFDVTPGEVYHLARISVHAEIDPAIGQALQRDKRLAAGVVAGLNVRNAAWEDLRAHNAANTTMISLEPNRADRTATLVVTPRRVATRP